VARTRTLVGLARALSCASVALAAVTILAVSADGRPILTGALALALVTTAGTLHRSSRLAPALFLVDVLLLLIAVALHLITR